MLIEPHQSSGALLRDIAAASEAPDTFHVWWLGQSGFLLKWTDHYLLFDPYLSDSLAKKYADTDKPHVRMTARCIDPAELPPIGTVTSTHNHTDHLDAETLLPLVTTNPELRLVLPEANRAFAMERLAANLPAMTTLNDGDLLDVGPWTFHGVASAHVGGTHEVARDAMGCCEHLGFVVEFGDFAVYHTGDTMWHPHLVPSLIDFQLDLVFVPINGFKAERHVSGNLNGTEAATLAKAVGAGMAIPHHYDMFEFNTETTDEFAAVCRRLDQPFSILRCGERWTHS